MKRKTQTDKELEELREGIKTFSDPPIDDLIAGIRGIDGGEWDHAKYQITETLRVLNDEELRDLFRLGNLPLLGWIDMYAEGRLKKKGWQDDSDSIWVWESVKKLKHLLAPNGKVNIDAVKTFLYTFAMTISLLRSGAIRGAAMQKARQIHAPKQKKNRYVMAHCRSLMKKKPSPSAAHLLSRFPKRESAVDVDGTKIYREVEDGEEKIFYIMTTGRGKSIGARAFANYWNEVKNIER